jgi:glutathione synthase/RimK-type ligase-like ATP-grasp enzyme
MSILIVVNEPKEWELKTLPIPVISAKEYLTSEAYLNQKFTKIINLCSSYRYQSIGYYVSLIAEAREHKPFPNVATIQDLKSQSIIRLISEELQELIQKSLSSISSKQFALSIYFGQNLAKRYERLSKQLFNLTPSPLLRATFVKAKVWQLQTLKPIAAKDIPDSHRGFVARAAEHYFSHKSPTRQFKQARYDLAILHNPTEEHAPSNAEALKKFIKAAESLRIYAELITREDVGTLLEYDALFIRETTRVNHHTYRIARKALAEGLVVIDDPTSIVKCSNKVFLYELMLHHKIPIPQTRFVNQKNLEAVAAELGYPLILKQPDSAFSKGVSKVESPDQLHPVYDELAAHSDLILAQEFVFTPYDWRVGILNGKPLFACKYHMVTSHWQIRKDDPAGKSIYGAVETFYPSQAPDGVIKTAISAAKLVGNGLYGVDIKERDHRVCVIEINDNPNIDAGYEDSVIRDDLYLAIMQEFLNRLEVRRTR